MYIHLNTVLEAKVNQEGVIRKGCTYRIVEMNDTTFSISSDKKIHSYFISNLSTFFNVINDALCPTCLKGLKVKDQQECQLCLDVDEIYADVCPILKGKT